MGTSVLESKSTVIDLCSMVRVKRLHMKEFGYPESPSVLKSLGTFGFLFMGWFYKRK